MSAQREVIKANWLQHKVRKKSGTLIRKKVDIFNCPFQITWSFYRSLCFYHYSVITHTSHLINATTLLVLSHPFYTVCWKNFQTWEHLFERSFHFNGSTAKMCGIGSPFIFFHLFLYVVSRNAFHYRTRMFRTCIPCKPGLYTSGRERRKIGRGRENSFSSV